VNQFDYTASGFDRGHMTPSADRLATLPLNQATFLMDNIIPQAPDNNQQTWNNMEQALRTLTPANELYIVSGGAGTGGSGDNGFATTIAGGRIAVPAFTWKVALVIPKGDNDISRVTCSSQTIAVIVPNTNGTNPDWTVYQTTVNAVEALTGYDFFSNLPDGVENCLEGAALEPAGSTLLNESCPAFNSAIDPGERVTVNLSLTNTGTAPTSNLVATLQSSGGVIAPSGPQSYGAIATGNNATRDFSFTAVGSCGSTITATLHLQDGAIDLGTVTYNFTLGVDTAGGFVCTSPCGGVRLVVTSQVIRSDPSTVQSTITVQNIGSETANNVTVTTAKLGSTVGTPLPQSLGNLAPGATGNAVVNFTNSTPGASSVLSIGGTYTGGTFSSSKRLTVP
jgi:DNA/RNA non-specific endonuclease